MNDKIKSLGIIDNLIFSSKLPDANDPRLKNK
jgi:hypothetical protein